MVDLLCREVVTKRQKSGMLKKRGSVFRQIFFLTHFNSILSSVFSLLGMMKSDQKMVSHRLRLVQMVDWSLRDLWIVLLDCGMPTLATFWNVMKVMQIPFILLHSLQTVNHLPLGH